MPFKKIASRSKVKAFVKVINYTHFMPTRYNFDALELPDVLKGSVTEKAKRKAARLALRKIFETRYKQGRNRWFFSKLRF